MGKIVIFGHKNPDMDSITSSLVLANLEKALGKDVEACRLGAINRETEYVLNYLGVQPPRLLEKVEDGTEVMLVDHANTAESIDNLENVKILKIVDHHNVALNTGYPLYYRAEPVGCTETILYKLYRENGIEIDKTIATLMLSSIISDTLLFKSPICTAEDIEIAKKLAQIAEINDIDTYGLEMLKAGTNLEGFSIEEILNFDAKEKNLKQVKSIVAQVNTASIEDVMTLKKDLEAGMQKIIDQKGLDLFVLLITDIVNSNSQVLVLGKRADLVEKSYGVTLEEHTALLKGVVSRKKQVVPVLTENA